jgi:transcriptional regulator with XRE-family HTH domain
MAEPDVLAAVGPRLRLLRERRDLTLTDVAQKTGISKSTLSRLENGQRKPSLELLLPLAETYHLPLDELVGARRSATRASGLVRASATDGWSTRSLSTRMAWRSGRS